MRSGRPGRLGWVLVALLAAVAQAQSREEMSRARDVVRALASDDPAALTALVDFERRAEERLARGLDPHHWSELDEPARQLAIQLAVDDWAGSANHFDRSATLVSVDAVPDPDAGKGPVPDRHVLRLVVRRLNTGEYRDLLLTLAPDLKVLDLEQGEPYKPGSNPAGPDGLLPQRRLGLPPAGVRWPENTDDATRRMASQFVDALLAAPEGNAAIAARETLHRNGRIAVAALVERLVALDAAQPRDAAGIARVVEALQHITGRVAAPPPPPPGGDPATPAGATPAAPAPAGATPPDTAPVAASAPSEAQDWVAWHAANGWTFLPVPLEGVALPLAGTDAAPATPPPAAPAPDAGADRGAPAAPTPPSESRTILFPAAAALPLRYAGKHVTGHDVEAQLPPSLRQALNTWAETAQRLDLTVISSGRPDHLVIGRASDKLLDQVAQWLDAADALLDPVIPLLAPREPLATVAFVFDEKGQRSPAWAGLLDDLIARDLAFAQDVKPLRTTPAGLTRRQVPFFIQLTWDLTGEGEFQLGNEVAGKFARCLVTSRVGELPPELLWGFDDLVELRLFKSVYQFDSTGFMFTADHFDWPVRTKQMLEKRQRGKGFSFAALAADAGSAGQPGEPQMITWAVLDLLCDERAADLHQLFADLAAAQDAVDPEHHASMWTVDRASTLAALAKTLDTVDPRHVETRLDRK